MSSRFAVAQLGARMHYAVPRILAAGGALERFFTDICGTVGWPRLLASLPSTAQPGALRRLLARAPRGLDSSWVTTFPLFGLTYAAKRARAKSRSEATAVHLWAGSEFCRLVLRRGLREAAGIYVFNSAGLELLQTARSSGRWAVVEQTIAPKRVEQELLAREEARFPEWIEPGGPDLLAGEFADREAAEWELAHTILCGSEFVKESIGRCGGPEEKCVVVPYGVELPGGASAPGTGRKRSAAGRKLRVLTVGAVGLRKGSPYVLEAAVRLKGLADFRLVRPVRAPGAVQNRLREHLELVGSVPRSEVAEHFAWADVFLLPSVCEGSATVTYEALAHGLPVVCTPNTGSVVRDGIEGLLVPPSSPDATVAALERLLTDAELRTHLAVNAKARAAHFTLERYATRLLEVLALQMRRKVEMKQ